MELALQIIANGLITGSFYALIAVGLAVIFGIMGVFNFAHGELYMLGAYTMWLLYTLADWPFLAAAAIAVLVVGAIGILLERGLFRPLREIPMNGLIASIGLLFILQVLVGQIWGIGLPKPVHPAYKGAVEFLGISGVTVGVQRFVVLPVALGSLGLLWVFLQKTKMGRSLRAVAQDREVAALQGMSINRTSAIAMGLGCAFAGLAGAFMAPVMEVYPYMGHSVILFAFVVLIVGGVGSLAGAAVAAFLMGIIYSVVATLLDGTTATIVGTLFMLAVLAISPRGILGRGAA
ncbi:branched-chain amino acid ABC transporter permease [Chloroflexota bacterium]